MWIEIGTAVIAEIIKQAGLTGWKKVRKDAFGRAFGKALKKTFSEIFSGFSEEKQADYRDILTHFFTQPGVINELRKLVSTTSEEPKLKVVAEELKKAGFDSTTFPKFDHRKILAQLITEFRNASLEEEELRKILNTRLLDRIARSLSAPTTEPPEVTTEEGKALRILVVISSPVLSKDDKPPSVSLDIWREWQNMAEAMRVQQGAYHSVILQRLFPPTHQKLEDVLLNEEYDVFHFIGHGTHQGLLFEDKYGKEDLVGIKELKRIFAQAKGLKLAVFNACYSFKLGEALRNNIASIIATTETILDDVAKLFADRFYAGLFGQMSVDAALRRTVGIINHKFGSQFAEVFKLIGDKDTSFELPKRGKPPKISLGEPPTYNLPYYLGFIGRGKELVAISRALENAQTRAIVLSGIGGIGKSWLAVEAVRRNAWRFPKGIIWFQAEEKSRFEHILESVGGFFQVKPEKEEIRRVLNTTRSLLVIDNVEVMGEQELKSLAEFLASFDPRRGSKVILTTRRHISKLEGIDGAWSYSVRELDEDRKLLLYEAKRQGIGDEIKPYEKEFLEYGRSHPFIISLAVAMAKRDGIEAALANLEALKGEDLEEAAEMFVGQMIKGLKSEAMELLKRLAIFAGGFDYPGVKEVCGTEGLDDLTKSSLTDYDLVKHRYSLLQLVLDYVKERMPLSTEEIEPLRLKRARYYLKVAKESNDPWPEIELDFANISQGADWVAGRIEKGGKDKDSLLLASDYAFALDQYIYRRSISQGLRWLMTGASACSEMGKRKEEANLYNSIGLRYHAQGDYPEALKWYEKSLKIKEEIGDLAGLAPTYNNIGSIHYAQGDYPEALKWYEKSLKIKEEIGDLAGLATTYNNIGLIYDAQGDYPEALKWHQKSLKIEEEIGDLAGLAPTYNNIGSIYYAQGDYPEALKWHQKSLKIEEEIGDLAGLATTYNNIGEIYRAQGDYPEALKWYMKDLKITEEIGDLAGLATTYNNIGSIYYAQGDYPEALKWHQKSLKIEEEIGDLAGLATTYNNIGLIYKAQGDYPEALKWYKKGLKILRQTGNKYELAVLLKNISLLYQKMGKKEEAKKYLQESQRLFKELGLEK